ncbi:putative molibdopterin-dependent oxidoreductase YjgC [Agromyces flavus]|uniref:2Fe-2S iron-sulfur cluster binding domain-containing protein n=1 Tax=Agromyces flavus TaxID=589382 RepID=A0A1H1PWV5_9MICO|nr:(2Fe-2S)-binding protein [Agromyces flavus]MCP2367844.1 putative molibdopterin-dependent oxidoreductase YjgC [Agromyces flavus]GGI47304.1 proline dehydrogenase [Agromyces flavus]SDS15688.1 2Fe-2S iron-sulfur cluster binding domain-containing protein [Agromyces flavus]
MSIRIVLDGAALEGRDGQTIAGVLIGAGHRSWRTAAGAERGVFCGIGICQDCLVTVNGVEGVRACQRTARDGDVIERESR